MKTRIRANSMRPEKKHSVLQSGIKVLGRYIKSPVFPLVVVLLAGIGFRFYKAHNTGIIYDEVWTYEDYCTDLHTAVHYYKSTNNHVLNSILIVLTRKVMGGYEHFIRVPALFFGTLFCISLTYIVHKSIRSSVMKIVIVSLILLNWFIFDLTYLARGYAIALGVTFTGIAVLMKLFSQHKKKIPVNWRIVILLIFLNFIALGSMVSSLSIVLCINLAYLLLMIFGSTQPLKKCLISALVRVIVMATGSAGLLYLLYRNVYSRISVLTKNAFRVEPFFQYLKKNLWEPFIHCDLSRIHCSMQVYKAALGLLILCAVICFLVFCVRFYRRKGRYLPLTSPAVLILLVSTAVLFCMFSQSVIFKRSLGMPRNCVFFLPLALISSGILMDRAVFALLRIKILAFILRFACIILLAAVTFLNFPSLQAVNVRPLDWGKQSALGPLVRMLQKIDPHKTWEIKLKKPYTNTLWRPIRYYKGFGYNCKLVKGKTYDVLIYPQVTPKGKVIFFEKERFDDHNCCIIINPDSFRKKPVIYQAIYYDP